MTVPKRIAENHPHKELTTVEVRAGWYRAHAVECAEFARHAWSRRDRATLRQMAIVWRHLAELVERFELELTPPLLREERGRTTAADPASSLGERGPDSQPHLP